MTEKRYKDLMKDKIHFLLSYLFYLIFSQTVRDLYLDIFRQHVQH